MGKPASTRKYWRVAPGFWSDEKVTGAEGGDPWTDDMKLLWMYLLTCEHRTAEGLFRLPKGYIEDDLGWTSERLGKPFQELLDGGFIKYDGRARLLLIVNALDYQSLENPNQIKAAIKALRDLPKSGLFTDLLQLADLYCKPFAEGLREGLGEPFPEGLGEPPTLPLPPALAPALLSEGSAASGDSPVDNSKEPDPFEDIDFGDEEDEPDEGPSEAQKLTAYYASEHKRLLRCVPKQKDTDRIAGIVTERLKAGRDPELIRAAIRKLVTDGKPPELLKTLIEEAFQTAPRDTFPKTPTPTAEDLKANAAAAAQARSGTSWGAKVKAQVSP